MSINIDVEELARQIAFRLSPQALLTAEDVAAMLKCSTRYVSEGYMKAPGFPRPLRLMGPNGRRSQPRWRQQDIANWIACHTDVQPKRGGRPRNKHTI